MTKNRHILYQNRSLWFDFRLFLLLTAFVWLAVPAFADDDDTLEVLLLEGDLELDVRGEWKATFSDNVLLDNENKKSDVALSFSAGLNLRYKTDRVSFSVDYFPEYYYFLRDNSTDLRHSLYLSLDGDVIKNNLSILGRAGIQQEFLDRTGSFSQNDATISDNRRTIQNYTTRAIWQNKFRDLATLSAAYEYGLVRSPADNLDDDTLSVFFSDTNSHNFNVGLSAGSFFNRLTWDASFSYQKVEKSLVEEDFSEKDYLGSLSYEFNPYVSASIGTGYTDNNAQSDDLSLNDNYTYYAIDIRPGPKLSIEASRKEYPTKNYDSLSLRYLVTKRLTLTVNHDVDFTSNSLQLAERLDQLDYEQTFGIDDGTGVPVDNSDISFSLTDVDYEQYVWRVKLQYQKRRDDFYISYSDEKRIYDSDEPDAISWGLNAGWSRQINQSTEMYMNGSYRRNITGNSARIDDYYTYEAGWQKTLSRYFNFTASYVHSERVSSDESGNLNENALVFYLRGTF